MSGKVSLTYNQIRERLEQRFPELRPEEIRQVHQRWTNLGKKSRDPAGLIGLKY